MFTTGPEGFASTRPRTPQGTVHAQEDRGSGDAYGLAASEICPGLVERLALPDIRLTSPVTQVNDS
jgi:hypothetical protein